MDVTTAKKVFEDYKNELAAVNPDLKEDIRKSQMAEIKDKYLEPIQQATHFLETEAETYRISRTKQMDKGFCLVRSALRETITDNNKALLATIHAGLPEDIMEHILNDNESPNVNLALLSAASKADMNELTVKIRAKGRVEPNTLMLTCKKEKEALEAQILGLDESRSDYPQKKLALGRRLAAVDQAIIEATAA